MLESKVYSGFGVKVFDGKPFTRDIPIVTNERASWMPREGHGYCPINCFPPVLAPGEGSAVVPRKLAVVLFRPGFWPGV